MTVLTVTLAAASVLPSPGAADEGPPAPTCGEPVTQNVTLTEDLHCGLRIDASDITVDLNGFTIHGDIDPDRDDHDGGAYQSLSDVTIRDGTVTGTIYLGEFFVRTDLRGLTLRSHTPWRWGVVAGAATRIVDSRIEGYGIGVVAFDYTDATVTAHDSTFENNHVGISSDAGPSELVGNRFVNNDVGVGLYEFEGEGVGGAGSVVTDNHFDHNGIGMEATEDGSLHPIVDFTVSGNTFRNNARAGFHLKVMGSRGTTAEVTDNHFQRNGHADGGDGLRIEAVFHPFDPNPIPSEALSGITVTANRALQNVGYGIAADGVTDGGRNTAARNGAGGCIGVRCNGGGNGRG